MEFDIIHELVNILQKSCDREPRIEPCLRYILGEHLDCCLSSSYINELYKDSFRLSPDRAQLLLFSENWNTERFRRTCKNSTINLNDFLDRLRALCEQSGLSNTCSNDVNLMIKSLLLLHFFGTPDTDLIFPAFNAKNCGYYSVPDQYNDAVTYLKQHNILFICGAPGTGKSELAKYIALSNHSFHNIGWVDAIDGSVSLKSQLEEVPFPQSSTQKTQIDISHIHDIFNRLKREPKTALLIIDLPFISKDDFKTIEKKLNGLDIRIIITTLTTNIPFKVPKISLDNQPIGFLKDIFDNIVKTEYFNDDEFGRFAENVSNNPLVVTLAAKTIIKSSTSPSKNAWLDSTRWILYESEYKNVHTVYKDLTKNKSPYNIKTLMRRLLFFYPYSFLANTANKLSVWCRQPIAKDFLYEHFSNEEINDALTYGILEYASPDEQYLKMPNILSYTIWEMYPVQYDDYYDKICEFIDSFKFGKDQKLSYKTLYTVIENMISRFHYQITFLPSRITRNQRDRFNIGILNSY